MRFFRPTILNCIWQKLLNMINYMWFKRFPYGWDIHITNLPQMTVFAHDTLIANLYTLMYAYFYNISTIDSAVLPLQFSTQCIRWPFFLCYNLRYRKLLEFAENRLHIFLNIIKKASYGFFWNQSLWTVYSLNCNNCR